MHHSPGSIPGLSNPEEIRESLFSRLDLILVACNFKQEITQNRHVAAVSECSLNGKTAAIEVQFLFMTVGSTLAFESSNLSIPIAKQAVVHRHFVMNYPRLRLASSGSNPHHINNICACLMVRKRSPKPLTVVRFHPGAFIFI